MKERVLISALVFLLVFVAIMPIAQAETMITLDPMGDTTVIRGHPNENQDNEDLHCRADDSTDGIDRAYLKFNLRSLPCLRIVSATLKLYSIPSIEPAGTLFVSAHETEDEETWTGVPWTETTLVWNNAPPPGDLIATTGVNTENVWYNWGGPTMLNYVQEECAGDGIISFCMRLNPENTARPSLVHRDFEDRENPSHGPKLEMEIWLGVVGGNMVLMENAPVDKFSLPTPYIGVASTILVATVATAIYVKRVKRE